MEKHQGNGFRGRIRIVIADDHPIFRDGLRRLVEYEPGFELVGEAGDGVDALEVIAKATPDILLLDVAMPKLSGLEVLRKLSRARVPMKTIMLTAAIEQQQITEALRLGARGVVLKQSATDLLVKSIQRVSAGEIWLDNRMTAEVMKAFSKSSESGPRREKPLLSDREKEIVQLVAQGFRNKEIGEKLFISEQTVKNHLHNIFDKLGVSDRLELALYAIHHRLIDHT